jgi:hypothetical protein
MVTIGWRLGKWREPTNGCGRGAGLKQRIQVTERDSHRLSEANEVLKRDVGEVADCSLKVKKGLTDLKWELEKPKQEFRAASAARRRCSYSAAVAPKSSASPPNAALPPPKPAPVEASAEFNSLKTSDPLHPLTPAPAQLSRLLLRLPMTLSIRFPSTAKICQNRTIRPIHSILKKLCGHSAPMSASWSSSSSLRAQAIRQWAVISGHESEPIPFSPLLLARKSRRYLEELVLGSGPGDIVIDSTFDRDSVLQFISACEGADFSLTISNVFEIELLCDEWSVFGKSIRQKVIEFIECPPSGQSLWLRRLLFRLGRGLSTSEAEDLLRCNLVGLVCCPAALDIPAAILSRIIDFRPYEGRREEHERLFTFSIEYLMAHGSSASQIMRTLDVTGLSDENLGRLSTLQQLNWSVLNRSVRRCLIGLRSELLRARQQKREIENRAEQQERDIKPLRNDVVREQSKKAGLETALEEQRQRNGKLEGERNRQEGIIAKQASELDVFKNATKKCENELKRATEANEAQMEELGKLERERSRQEGTIGKLTAEIKAMKAKEGRLGKEVAQLTNLLKDMVLHPEQANAGEIIKRIIPESKQFPPSVKKVRGFEVPGGIIAHLTRECGENVHDCDVVDVTSGSFEKVTQGANPHSGAYDNNPSFAAKNAADLETVSFFCSAFRKAGEDIPHMRNNWVCYDFKERRIVPTHYTIRTNRNGQGGPHLKSWLVETSVDGENWREVAREENNNQFNGALFTATFPVRGGGECRFIRLVNIGRNHNGNNVLWISAWEIFGSLFE